ncbi:aminoglycoside phosphotransferase family protein [Candidatus Saccharibacteria bacterium]|nr:aminoglycoside phosphotransferase family protein [Candidatus Saccharibacteria bacterium]
MHLQVPAHRCSCKKYKKEIAVLNLLESVRLWLRTPIVKWEGPQSAWFGYIGVPGLSIKSRITQLTTPQKEQIGASLGRFLDQLHELKPTEMPHTTLQQEIAKYQDDYQRGLAYIEAAFTKTERAVLKRFYYKELPEEITKLGYVPKFCHGDLLLNNILIDTHDQIGVIDFGDARYYDQSKDFSNLWDDTIRNAALSAYSADKNLVHKVNLRFRALPISGLSFYVNQQNNAGIERELRNIRNTLSI